MEKRILVTGSQGLIGRYMIPLLIESGYSVLEFDLRDPHANDLRRPDQIEPLLPTVTGVLHLGAVSRVVWGQKDPENCLRVNRDATRNLLRACLEQKRKPWVVYASSREVYGQARKFPVAESDLLDPINAYARSKAEAEQACLDSVEAGLVANIVRFSSVYGCPDDHPDRVAPAFARAAAFGGDIRLEGRDNVLDFTFIDDVVQGLMTLVQLSEQGNKLPPVHLVSGNGTSLLTLANMARDMSHFDVKIVESAPRNYDVSQFVGDPARAASILGWTATTTIEAGFEALLDRLRARSADMVEGLT